jgi:hypothetical protein
MSPHSKGSELFETLPCGDEEQFRARRKSVGLFSSLPFKFNGLAAEKVWISGSAILHVFVIAHGRQSHSADAAQRSQATSALACGEASTAIMKYMIVTKRKPKRYRVAFMPSM